MSIRLNIVAAFLILSFTGKCQCLISGLSNSYCVNASPVTLTTAIPGGTLSGPGIVNNSFDPSAAGAGTHTIQYNYCSTSYSLTSIPYTYTSNGMYVVPQLADNEISAAIPIGFTFKFFCDTFSQVYISSNGFITFSQNQSDGCCQGLFLPAAAPAPKNIISLCWTDLNPSFGGTIRYELFGTAPNRVFMVNYNCIFHHNNGNGGDPVTGFILLYETSNIIELNLGVKPAPSYSINSTVGIQDNSGTLAYTVPGKNGTPNWSSSYQAYRFTPGPTCDITETTNVINTPTVTLAWGKLKLCKGESTVLVAYGANNYVWSTGSQNYNIVVQPPSTSVYSVTGTSINGCSSTSTVQIKVEQCTSLFENEIFSDIEMYPNPSQGIVNIKHSINQKLEVYNSFGQLVKVVELIGGFNTQVDLSSMPSGFYFFLDSDRNKKYTHVMIK